MLFKGKVYWEDDWLMTHARWKLITIKKLEDLKVLRRSPDHFNNVKIGQGQLQLIIKHILFYHIWGLTSDLKQSNEYSIKQPSYFWETNVYVGMWQSKWVALNKRSQVSLTLVQSHCLTRLKISRKYDFGLNSYRKMNFSIFFPYKCIRNQIWPCHKVCQARFIICANLVETTSTSYIPRPLAFCSRE